MGTTHDSLNAALTPFLSADISPYVRKAAKRIAKRFPNCSAVLFYGSCLRTGEVEGQMLDFYVIVDDYRGAFKSWGRVLGNRLIPPNVFYFEEEIDGLCVRAKYATLSSTHFERLCSDKTFNPAIWARFAQPIALAYFRDEQISKHIAHCLGLAITTLLSNCAPLIMTAVSEKELWAFCFSQTYTTEFRAENGGRPELIYDLMSNFYHEVTSAAVRNLSAIEERETGQISFSFAPKDRREARIAWFFRRIQGKLLHALRLIKGATTFDGGIDYLAWKIYRHSGVKMEIKPWHRRFPVIAGLIMLPRLRHKGAVK
ncbi:MAG: hypothetical protein PVF65_08025 [Sphingomonadales bacterium]|jgi:hypothetical protein